ncbi:PfkB family carbohydrate kinase [uncultured Cellulomonas sp.]|uniref:PfkB family carbohydrate kinase n=1 Tax=uncultured Cellulomonas sp. TaxID=189682 RepID=UPI0028E9DA40|nr:PfkB family carbohydrate kinase [uncultured Cellulomonas sp.]
MSPLLVCCGLATLDVVQVVDRVPGADEKVVARSVDVTFGGPAANAAATAVALGVRTVLVTALGVGSVADIVRAGLVAAGVEVVDLAPGPGSPAVSTVLVTRATGERAVVSVNATGTADLREPPADLLEDATTLLVDGHHLRAAHVLARAARARGIPVLLDGGSWKPGLDRLLAHVDHAVLSADFALPGGGGLEDVLTLGPSLVAQSAGSGPVRVLRVGRPAEVLQPPTVAAADVVDTLGAGDVLHGATAAALATGQDVLTALREGVVRASESVRHRGALGWVYEV